MLTERDTDSAYTNRQIYPTIYLKFEFFINSPYKVIITTITTITATDKNSKNIIVHWENCFTIKWLQKIKMNSVCHLSTERGVVIRRLFHWLISLIIKSLVPFHGCDYFCYGLGEQCCWVEKSSAMKSKARHHSILALNNRNKGICLEHIALNNL